MQTVEDSNAGFAGYVRDGERINKGKVADSKTSAVDRVYEAKVRLNMLQSRAKNISGTNRLLNRIKILF